MSKAKALRTTVVSPVRNEGPFVVDWVCWNRLIGFDDIVVLSNDCTDHTAELLDALHRAGWLHHLRCTVEPGRSVYRTKLAAAMALRQVRRAGWVMVCDADEYLVIHRGQGKLADLLGAGPPAFLGMAINWRVFGNNGVDRFADLPVHQQFFGATAPDNPLNAIVKTIHRRPRWFQSLGDHGPVMLDLDRAQNESRRRWGEVPLVWVNSAGKTLTTWDPTGPYTRRLRPEDCDQSCAQINHYMLRSAESYSLKRGTLSPSAQKDRYTDDYWARADEVSTVDTTILRHEAEFATLRAAAMALPDVARLHYQCCADHIRLIAEKAGQRAGEDPRHAAFLAQAADLE